MVIYMIKNLKALRNERKISQQQLAEIIMVSQQSVNKYENHDVEPDICTLVKIADFFNVSLDYLVGRTDMKEMAEKEKMSDLSDDEVSLIKLYRKLNNIQKDCIFTVLNSYRTKRGC